MDAVSTLIIIPFISYVCIYVDFLAKPVIIAPPPATVTACLGDVVQIACKAVGVPVPFITWRCNWGAVCSPPRCTQTSEDGYGVLTIRDAR